MNPRPTVPFFEIPICVITTNLKLGNSYLSKDTEEFLKTEISRNDIPLRAFNLLKERSVNTYGDIHKKFTIKKLKGLMGMSIASAEKIASIFEKQRYPLDAGDVQLPIEISSKLSN
jgi:hypothetical protein